MDGVSLFPSQMVYCSGIEPAEPNHIQIIPTVSWSAPELLIYPATLRYDGSGVALPLVPAADVPDVCAPEELSVIEA